MQTLTDGLLSLLPVGVVIGFFFIMLKKANQEAAKKAGNQEPATSPSPPMSAGQTARRRHLVRLILPIGLFAIIWVMNPEFGKSILQSPFALMVAGLLLIALFRWMRRRESGE